MQRHVLKDSLNPTETSNQTVFLVVVWYTRRKRCERALETEKLHFFCIVTGE